MAHWCSGCVPGEKFPSAKTERRFRADSAPCTSRQECHLFKRTALCGPLSRFYVALTQDHEVLSGHEKALGRSNIQHHREAGARPSTKGGKRHCARMRVLARGPARNGNAAATNALLRVHLAPLARRTGRPYRFGPRGLLFQTCAGASPGRRPFGPTENPGMRPSKVTG